MGRYKEANYSPKQLTMKDGVRVSSSLGLDMKPCAGEESLIDTFHVYFARQFLVFTLIYIGFVVRDAAAF